MKTLFALLFVTVTFGLQAQTEVDFLKTLGNGDLSSVKTYLAPDVTISIDDYQAKVSSSAAVKKLMDFFNNKKIVSYKILHNGKASDSSSSYRVARIKTEKETFRVFAYSESGKNNSKVIEIRVDTM